MGLQAVTGILTGIGFYFWFMDKRTKKEMKRLTLTENPDKAPISSVADTEAQVATDTKYTNV
jgi:hypothetical protein